MPEINYKRWVPSKTEVIKYLNDSQIAPLNVHAIWFELLKLINQVKELQDGK